MSPTITRAEAAMPTKCAVYWRGDTVCPLAVKPWDNGHTCYLVAGHESAHRCQCAARK